MCILGWQYVGSFLDKIVSILFIKDPYQRPYTNVRCDFKQHNYCSTCFSYVGVKLICCKYSSGLQKYNYLLKNMNYTFCFNVTLNLIVLKSNCIVFIKICSRICNM